jgi:hypothetical protein
VVDGVDVLSISTGVDGGNLTAKRAAGGGGKEGYGRRRRWRPAGGARRWRAAAMVGGDGGQGRKQRPGERGIRKGRDVVAGRRESRGWGRWGPGRKENEPFFV